MHTAAYPVSIKAFCFILWLVVAGLPCGAIESVSQPTNYNFLLVNDAQTDSLGAILCSSPSHLLLSASDDGSVNVYRDGLQLVQHLQISSYPISKIAFDGDSRIAVLEQKPDKKFRLSLWNWKSGTELWFAELEEQALSITFSPRGSFVVCSLARWNSLLFIDSETGAIRPWLQQGFGIVDYNLVSSKEERVLSYNGTSGILSYHDLSSGAEIKKFSTKNALKQFQVVPDNTRSRACAIDGKNVVTVDLLNGDILSSGDPGFIPTLLVCDDTVPGRVVVFGGTSGAIKAQSYIVDSSNGNLGATGSIQKIALKNGFSSAGILDGQIFVGDGDGFLYRSVGDNAQQLVLERKLGRIVSTGFADSSLYLSTSIGFFRIKTDLASLKSFSSTLQNSPKITQLPAIAPRVGVSNLDEHQLLLWDRSSNPRLYRFDCEQDTIKTGSAPLGLSLLKVKSFGQQVLSVDIGGQVRINNCDDFSLNFSRNVLGALGAETLGNGEILVVKASSGNSDSPLLRIIQRTGETIAIPSSDNAVFLSRTSLLDGGVYTLSVSRKDGVSSTLVKRLNPKSIADTPTTVMSFPGENFQADLITSNTNPVVYTSAGRRVINTWDGQSIGALEPSLRFPRQLSTWGNVLTAINTDGSLSLWDTESKKLLMDIFVLDTGTCFFLTRNGNYGIMEPADGYKTSADSLRDRAQVESILRPNLVAYESGSTSVRPVAYPLTLP